MKRTLHTNRLWRGIVLAGFLAVAVVFSATVALAAADSYPNKPVRLLIAFAPGGSTDAMGRLIATKLSERLGKPFVVENQAGGGGTIASEMVARSAPDGHTLLFNSTGIILNPLLGHVPYDPMKSFVPIAKIGNAVSTLVVHPSVPANSVKELIALAKKQPGKLVASAAGGGSFIHLSTELFKMMADIDFKIVQFKGGGPAMIDLLGGHSQLFVGSLQQSLPHIKSGKVRALGYGAKTRSKSLPDVPTISEAGVPGYESFIWWGLFAPAGTPKAIVDKLNKELETVMKTEEMAKIFVAQGAEQDLLGPAAFTKFMESESAKWGKVIKQGNIKLE
ncbi:MAG: tripartite tricarboxylate transporter substrate binding protein [Deltaproteobacteria bacterium]|nr:tripartite tricarboxylate transporter substrate binding protein [Deltaproteobacteria bacterium]